MSQAKKKTAKPKDRGAAAPRDKDGIIQDDGNNDSRGKRFDIYTDGVNSAYSIVYPAELNPERSVYVRELYVDPEYRSKGQARQLLKQVLAAYPEQDVVLQARPFRDKPRSLKDLRAFYASQGAIKYPYHTNRLYWPREREKSASEPQRTPRSTHLLGKLDPSTWGIGDPPVLKAWKDKESPSTRHKDMFR